MSEFDVVFICTGNVFRSALAEAVFRARIAGFPARASSAGTLDLGDVPAHAEAIAIAPELGIDLSEHRARCVAHVDLDEADLVLGFERSHVAAAVVDAGAARDRTFTLPELVELLDRVPAPAEGDPAERARALVAAASAQRLPGAGFPEIPDPIGKPRPVFAATAREVADLTAAVAEALFPEST
jgi:protein-tyrosine phosphatase